MIKLTDYLAEEIETATQEALSNCPKARAKGINFLFGLRQGAYHLVGMSSGLYKRIDKQIDRIFAERNAAIEEKAHFAEVRKNAVERRKANL